MNTEIIVETSLATLAGTISFPEVVQRLIAAGVESYQVDYMSLRKTYYSAHGAVVVTPITYEGLPEVAPDFAAENLKSAILDSQRNGQKYRDFTRRAIAAGVQSYVVFLRGKRVTYWGRNGDQHTEWFLEQHPLGRLRDNETARWSRLFHTRPAAASAFSQFDFLP